MIDERTAIRNICDIRDILYGLGITCWLTDGTLLGAYRDKTFIRYDKDTDLGIDASQFRPELIDYLRKKGFYLISQYGLPECGLELSFSRDKVKTDLFFFYRNWDGRVWHAAWEKMPDGLPRMIQYWYPPFGLQYFEFLSERFLVPQDIENYLTLKYGDWRTPVQGWDWKYGPKNHKKTGVRIPGGRITGTHVEALFRSESSEYTFLIKTFERRRCLERLLDSISTYAPNVPVVIVDDSRTPFAGPQLNTPGVTVVPMPFDSGLSAGRNYGLKHVKTPYFVLLDDDYVLNEHSRVEELVEGVASGFFDIVGAPLWHDGGQHFDPYCRCLRLHDNKLYDVLGYYEQRGDLYLCDKVFNFFAARVDTILNFGGWDEDLKLIEHTDFFLRFKNWGGKVGWYPKVAASHSHEGSVEYRKFRGRIQQFRKLAMARGGFKEHLRDILPRELLPVWPVTLLKDDVLKPVMDALRPGKVVGRVER